MFCNHEWIKIKKTYAPPSDVEVDGLRGTRAKEVFERLVHGLTTILWECKKCHKIRKVEMLGSDE